VLGVFGLWGVEISAQSSWVFSANLEDVSHG